MEKATKKDSTNNIAEDIQQQMCSSCKTQSNAITINNFGGKNYLQVIITAYDGGYVGIRHHEYNVLHESYATHQYKNQDALRNYLQSLGYITNSDKWLGFKTFGQYKSDPQNMMSIILAEIKSLLLVINQK